MTGQPTERLIAAVERAVAVLGFLAEGPGDLGTAVGKVYLAHGGALAAGPLRAYTGRTIVDAAMSSAVDHLLERAATLAATAI